MTVKIERHGPVTTVALSRPDVLNAINPDLLEDLQTAIRAAEAEGSAVVITGNGRAFSAGADLKYESSVIASEAGADGLSKMLDLALETARLLRTASIPIVSAINGVAAGGGLALALGADVRLMSEDARLVPAFVGVDAVPDGGVPYFLTQLVGAFPAASLLLRNRPIIASEALAQGLVSDVVPSRELLGRAREEAIALTHISARVLRAVRELTSLAATSTLADYLDAERHYTLEQFSAATWTERVTTFADDATSPRR